MKLNKSMNTSEISSTDGLVDILSLLDFYQHEHEEATSLLKKALWSLTKARHSKKSFMSVDTLLVADDVREEVRPRVVLIDASEDPEFSVKGNQEEDRTIRYFATADPIHLIESMKENQSTPSLNVVDEGLRQRKNETKALPTAWTVEQHEFYDEEARLSRIDPLDLFGGSLSARELKIAQEKARKSLESYVKVANLKIAIDRSLKRMSDKKKHSTA